MAPGESLASRRRRSSEGAVDRAEPSPRGAAARNKKQRGKTKAGGGHSRGAEEAEASVAAGEAPRGPGDARADPAVSGDGDGNDVRPPSFPAGSPSLGAALPSRRLLRLAGPFPSHAPALSLLALALWALETALPQALSVLLALGRTDVVSDVTTGLRLSLREPVREGRAAAAEGVARARGAALGAWEKTRDAVGEAVRRHVGEVGGAQGLVANCRNSEDGDSAAGAFQERPSAPSAAGRSLAALVVRTWLRLRGICVALFSLENSVDRGAPTKEDRGRDASLAPATTPVAPAPGPRSQLQKRVEGMSTTDLRGDQLAPFSAESRADALLAGACFGATVLALPPTRRALVALFAGVLSAFRALFLLPLAPFRPVTALVLELARPGASCVVFFAAGCALLGLLAQLARPKAAKASPEAASAARDRLRAGLAALAALPLAVALSGGWAAAAVALFFFSAAVEPWVRDGTDSVSGAHGADGTDGQRPGGANGWHDGGARSKDSARSTDGEGDRVPSVPRAFSKATGSSSSSSASTSASTSASSFAAPDVFPSRPPLPAALLALLSLSLCARLALSMLSLFLRIALPSLLLHPVVSLRSLAGVSRRVLLDAPAALLGGLDASLLAPRLVSPLALLIAARAPLPRGRGWASASGRADLWLVATLTAWLWRRAAGDPAARAALALGAVGAWVPPSFGGGAKRETETETEESRERDEAVDGGEKKTRPAPGRLGALLRRAADATLGERRAEAVASALAGFERRSSTAVLDAWRGAGRMLHEGSASGHKGARGEDTRRRVPEEAGADESPSTPPSDSGASPARSVVSVAQASKILASAWAAMLALATPFVRRSRALLRGYTRAVSPWIAAGAPRRDPALTGAKAQTSPVSAPPRLAPWLPLLSLWIGRRAVVRVVRIVGAGGARIARPLGTGAALSAAEGAGVSRLPFPPSLLVAALQRAVGLQCPPGIETDRSIPCSLRSQTQTSSSAAVFSSALALALLPLLCCLGRRLECLCVYVSAAAARVVLPPKPRARLASVLSSLLRSRDPAVDGWTPPFAPLAALAEANGRKPAGRGTHPVPAENARAPSRTELCGSAGYRATDVYAFSALPPGAPAPAWRVVPADETPAPPGAWGAPWSLRAPEPAVPLLSLRKKKGVPLHLGEEAPEGASEVVQRILGARNYYEVLGFGVDGQGLFGDRDERNAQSAGKTNGEPHPPSKGGSGQDGEQEKGRGEAGVAAPPRAPVGGPASAGDGSRIPPASTSGASTNAVAGKGDTATARDEKSAKSSSHPSRSPAPSSASGSLPGSLFPTTLPSDAIDERVRRARRRLALLTHPDRAAGRAPGAPRAFELVTLAAEALETGRGREAYLESALKPPMELLDVVAEGMGLASLVFGEIEARRGASAGELLLTVIEQHIDELERGALLWPCKACGRVHAVLPLPGRNATRARAWTVDDDGKRLRRPVLLPAGEGELWLERGAGGGPEEFGAWGDVERPQENEQPEGWGEWGEGERGEGGARDGPERDGGVADMAATEAKRNPDASVRPNADTPTYAQGSEASSTRPRTRDSNPFATSAQPSSSPSNDPAPDPVSSSFLPLPRRSFFSRACSTIEVLKTLPVRLAYRAVGAVLWRLRAARHSRRIRVLLSQNGRVWDFTEPGACLGYLSSRDMLALYPFGMWENPFAAFLERGGGARAAAHGDGGSADAAPGPQTSPPGWGADATPHAASPGASPDKPRRGRGGAGDDDGQGDEERTADAKGGRQGGKAGKGKGKGARRRG